MKRFILTILIIILFAPNSLASDYYTYGAYENTGLNVDSHSGNTSITCSGLNGGGTAGNWIGFKATITAGTGSGSAVITAWDDDTDTITVGAGLSDVTDNDTFSVVCQYATVGSGNLQDNYIYNANANKHFGGEDYMTCEYDTGGSYRYPILYIPFIGNGLSGGETINTATLYCYITTSYLSGSCDVVVGKMVDASVSPNSTPWEYTGVTEFNNGATWEYRDDSIESDWEADTSINFEDIFSAVQSSAVVITGSDDNVWKSWNIQPIVEDLVTDGDDNIGIYVRNTTNDSNYFYIAGCKRATTTQRWFIVVNYASAGGGIIKTINGLDFASVKTVDGLAIGSVKTINGAAAQ